MNPRSVVAILFVAMAAVVRGSEEDERLARLPPDARGWLQDEVLYIITEKERDTFLDLQTIDERKAFIEAFWRKRDPVPRLL
jgi:hypothetical protein